MHGLYLHICRCKCKSYFTDQYNFDNINSLINATKLIGKTVLTTVNINRLPCRGHDHKYILTIYVYQDNSKQFTYSI